MKITKRQLKRIIKEERAKLLKEQGGEGDLTPEQEARAMQIIYGSFEQLEEALSESGIEMAYMGQFQGLIRQALERY